MYVNDNIICTESRPLVGRRPPAVTSVHDPCNLRTYTQHTHTHNTHRQTDTHTHTRPINRPPHPLDPPPSVHHLCAVCSVCAR